VAKNFFLIGNKQNIIKKRIQKGQKKKKKKEEETSEKPKKRKLHQTPIFLPLSRLEPIPLASKLGGQEFHPIILVILLPNNIFMIECRSPCGQL